VGPRSDAGPTAWAGHDDVQIAYDVGGFVGGRPLLLIIGMGSQLIEWPAGFCAALADRGFCFARFDNRDSGLSTHFTDRGVPDPIRLLLRPSSVAAYRLTDMAGDALAVLDALGWASADVVGLSMGGIVAQTLAIGHPGRVRSLTLISSTPWWRIGTQRLWTTVRAAIVYKRRCRNSDEAGRRAVDMARIMASPGYPFEAGTMREVGRQAYLRDRDPTGTERQNAAVLANPDLRAGLGGLQMPTLVIHGDADVMIRPRGGRAIAAAVPGARWVQYSGLNHDLPRQLWPSICEHIRDLSEKADEFRRPAAS
jgi:pimeloyl-ACP methyl ester carboxylesterase